MNICKLPVSESRIVVDITYIQLTLQLVICNRYNELRPGAVTSHWTVQEESNRAVFFSNRSDERRWRPDRGRPNCPRGSTSDDVGQVGQRSATRHWVRSSSGTLTHLVVTLAGSDVIVTAGYIYITTPPLPHGALFLLSLSLPYTSSWQTIVRTPEKWRADATVT